MANKETVLSVTLKMIRALLQELIDRIDSGRCSTTEEQNERFLSCLEMFAGSREKTYNKTEAMRYLGMSRSKFDKLRREGKIPQGKKVVGDVSRRWTKEELDAFHYLS